MEAEEELRDEVMRMIAPEMHDLCDAEAAQVADEILEAVHRRLVGRDVYVGTGSLTLAEITQRLGL